MSESEGMQTDGEYPCATCGEPLNIIGIIQHSNSGCDPVLDASALSQSERATLMYVETRVVDHAGELDQAQMNYEDQQNLKLFGAAGILDVAWDGEPSPYKEGNPEVVKFTDAAWDLVRDSRQIRAAQRMDPETVGLPPDGGEDGQ